MARIRTLKPTIWESEQVAGLPAEVQILFIGLITQADDEGRQKGSPQLIRSKVFPYSDHSLQKIREWLQRLVEAGLIYWYKVGGKEFIELPTWHDHQRVSHATESVLPSHSEADSADAPEPLRNDSGITASGRERKGREEEGKGRESEIEPIPDAPLSVLLADLIEANGASRPRIGKKWADAERLMLDRDKRDPAQAEKLLRWCQKDEFWRGNILSMPKFREKYDQLLLQAKRGSKQSPGIDRANHFAQRAREAA